MNPVFDITLDDILSNTVEEGDCLLWTGHSSEGKFPRLRKGGGQFVVRRLLWSLAHEAMPNGLQVGCSCKSPLCVHPDHLVVRTKAKAQRGAKRTPDVCVRVATVRRAKSKLTMEVVRQIRLSDEPNRDVDRRLGLARGQAWAIRRNLAWVDRANPFAGLGA